MHVRRCREPELPELLVPAGSLQRYPVSMDLPVEQGLDVVPTLEAWVLLAIGESILARINVRVNVQIAVGQNLQFTASI